MPSVAPIIVDDAIAVSRELRPLLAKMSGKVLLVTGAAGFLCSYILDVLAAFNDERVCDPCTVIAVDNFATGIAERVKHLDGRPDIMLLHADASEPLQIDEHIDYYIHGASIASPLVYRTYPLETIRVNVMGTWHLLERARQQGAESFLYLSSSEVYGDPDPKVVPTPETYWGHVSCTGPRACYDESKRLAETLCMTYFRQYGTPVKVARPFNSYGPGQRLDDKRIIPDIMTACLDGQDIVLFSDGRATRSFCYVKDTIRGFLYAMLSDHNGEAFNVGNPDEISIREVAETAAQLSRPPIVVRYAVSADKDYLTDNPNRRCPDVGKLMTLTGWTPQVPLLDGLRRTLDYYRSLRK